MTQYSDYVNYMQKYAHLSSIWAVLNWDQEVNMPAKWAEARAQQNMLISWIAHEHFTNKEFWALLENLLNDSSLDDIQRRNVELTYEDYQRETKLPLSFVEEFSRLTSIAQVNWAQARATNNFSLFQSDLEKIVEMSKQKAEYLGYQDHPYEALVDLYEPKMSIAALDKLFEQVKINLTPIAQKIFTASAPQDLTIGKHYSTDKQTNLWREVAAQLGFNFDAGILSLSTHPFSTAFHPLDTRITTRVKEDDLMYSLGSTIHETWHAMYEQWFNPEWFWLPQSQAIGLAFHESQSRLWENNVWKSKDFWLWQYHLLQKHFPEVFNSLSLDDFYKSINIVQPSFIRTEADEISYHFHVMIRYEVEKKLISWELQVKDVPAYWSSMYKQYLWIDIPSDSVGVLQDVHWSCGLIGYFPTYSLGSFYAAQLFYHADKQIGGLKSQLRSWNCKQLHAWLSDNVYKYGRYYSSQELCKKITWEELDLKYFIEYVKEKYSKIYNIDL